MFVCFRNRIEKEKRTQPKPKTGNQTKPKAQPAFPSFFSPPARPFLSHADPALRPTPTLQCCFRVQRTIPLVPRARDSNSPAVHTLVIADRVAPRVALPLPHRARTPARPSPLTVRYPVSLSSPGPATHTARSLSTRYSPALPLSFPTRPAHPSVSAQQTGPISLCLGPAPLFPRSAPRLAPRAVRPKPTRVPRSSQPGVPQPARPSS